MRNILLMLNPWIEAVSSQPGAGVAQPDVLPLTPTERMLIRFYRQLGEGERAFMRRAIEAVAARKKP